MLPDNLLLQSIKQQIAKGDPKAFRQLFDNFSQKLAEFAFTILKSNDAATEVVDNVFVNIWKNKHRVPEIESLKTYLYKSVKNSALNYLAQKANEVILEPFDYISIQLKNEECPEQQMISAEIFKKIKGAVNELPPKCKMIFKLVREDGLKYKEVAEILNISVNTVDTQMVIAVKRISEKVKNDLSLAGRLLKKK